MSGITLEGYRETMALNCANKFQQLMNLNPELPQVETNSMLLGF